MNENAISYSGDIDKAEKYFEKSFSKRDINKSDLLDSLSSKVPTANINDDVISEISPQEIKRKIKLMSNSAPGSDRVEYRHLKLVDPDCNIVSTIFN